LPRWSTGDTGEDEMTSVGTWRVTLQLFELEDSTSAHAVLSADTGTAHVHLSH
jgi:hypothetical protein